MSSTDRRTDGQTDRRTDGQGESSIPNFVGRGYNDDYILWYQWCHWPQQVEAPRLPLTHLHYSDVIMSVMVYQITKVSIVYSSICSGTDQRKHQSSTSLAFVRGIHRSPVNSPHKGPVTWKIFPFDHVIMYIFILPFSPRRQPHLFSGSLATLVCNNYVWMEAVV